MNSTGDGRELNLLVEDPQQRVGRRGFLRAAALLGAAGAAGGITGGVAGYLAGQANREDDRQDRATAGAAGPRRREQTLNIYNWSDYIDETTIPRFQALANIRVNYDVYSSNEDLLAKMRAGPTTYDIIVPTNQFIPTYRRLGLLQPLRQDLIPNLVNLDKAFVETDYDPGNKYTIPWQWGTTGIGYNTKRVPGGTVDSWTALYEPNPSLGGRISILREVTDLIGCTLIYLGKDPNSTRDADLQQVVGTFKDLRRRVKDLKFSSDTYIDQLATGELWLAHGWSGDVFQAQGDNADISYVIPKEGSLQWADVMCVPKDAPHPENAARFMNYVLHPKTAARISNYVSYGTPVPLAKSLLPSEQLDDPGIYPPSSIKLSFLTLNEERIKKLQGVYNTILGG
ncbi:MAG TPA: spermidine/putrescine ABC transporter substrate-binding protein [Actinomycetota bacterium]|nr:spermidine/putrescine ABC transporter substrate-binding protein [Actinomycetota bacterium]